jgi:CBS domain-containing protein
LKEQIMWTTSQSLAALTASKLMSTDLVLIPSGTPLRAAAQQLLRAQVSGAPVVDEQGRCLGVLSASDFVRWAETKGLCPPGSAREAEFVCPWQLLDVNRLPLDTVEAFMTRDPVMASPAASIRELARTMLDADIHRVVIVNEKRRPLGIVSSTDILAAVARGDTTAGREEKGPRPATETEEAPRRTPHLPSLEVV